MKLSALKNSYWVLAAMIVSFVSLVGPQKSFATDATDTLVTCNTPQVQLAAGRDGTKPRVTIYYADGSSVSGIFDNLNTLDALFRLRGASSITTPMF
jgi:hypothetical protein